MSNLLLCCLIVVASARSLDDDVWKVYFSTDFINVAECAPLHCDDYQACLVKGVEAFCVKQNELHLIHGLKFDVRSELFIDIDGNEKTDTIDSINRIKAERTQEVNTYHEEVFPKHETEEHKHTARYHDKSEQLCHDSELQAVQFRLLQWFKDVHEQSGTAAEKPLPVHHIVCPDHVSWMFTQWDGNDNGELTVEELNSVENDPYERCIGAFLDRCDDNADNVLSLDEWCDCFLWTDDHHTEPACHAAKHKVDPHVLGVYVPRCTVDGYYHVEQCHENHCWCVDKYGREFDRSRVEGRRPDCGQYAESKPMAEL